MILKTIEKIRKMRSHPGTDKVSLLKLAGSGAQYYIRSDGRAAPPMKVYLAVNTVCNANCRMCDVNKKDAPTDFTRAFQMDGGKTEVPIERLKRYASEFAAFKPTVSVMAAEPLLYSNIIEAAEAFTRAGCVFHLTTNGMLLPRYAEALVKAGVDNIFVSVDGLEAVHDYVRGVKGIFKNLEAGIHAIDEAKKKLGAAKPSVGLNFTLSNDNCRDIVPFAEKVATWPIDHVYFCHTNFITKDMSLNHNRKHGSELPISEMSTTIFDPLKMDAPVIYEQIAEIKKILGPRISFIPELDKQGIDTYYRDHETFVAEKKCMLPWGAVMIKADGGLLPMSRCFPIDYGNVADTHFLKVWNGEKMRAFRVKLKRDGAYPACSRCCAIL